jgi:hypothetical protein
VTFCLPPTYINTSTLTCHVIFVWIFLIYSKLTLTLNASLVVSVSKSHLWQINVDISICQASRQQIHLWLKSHIYVLLFVIISVVADLSAPFCLSFSSPAKCRPCSYWNDAHISAMMTMWEERCNWANWSPEWRIKHVGRTHTCLYAFGHFAFNEIKVRVCCNPPTATSPSLLHTRRQWQLIDTVLGGIDFQRGSSP